MKITFELTGRRPTTQHFVLSSADGKDINAWQKACELFKERSNVLGLEVNLSGGRPGVITLVADNDQLRPTVVADIRSHVENALGQI